MNDVEQARFDRQYARHVNDLKLQGIARPTIEPCSFALRRIGVYFDRCPDKHTLDELARIVHRTEHPRFSSSWSGHRPTPHGSASASSPGIHQDS